MKNSIVCLSLSILLSLTANQSCLFAQSAVPENAPIIPDTTGMHYFVRDTSVSERDYLSVIEDHSWYFRTHGTMLPKDVIEIMPSSRDEGIIFYYLMVGDTREYSPNRRCLQKAYQLLWQYASSDSKDKDIKECFFLALSMDRSLPVSLPIEFLMDFDTRLKYNLVGKGAQRFLCLYSSFTDESLKDSYRDLYNTCYYTRYIDPRNLED